MDFATLAHYCADFTIEKLLDTRDLPHAEDTISLPQVEASVGTKQDRGLRLMIPCPVLNLIAEATSQIVLVKERGSVLNPVQLRSK